ncbi:MAG: hypothetical protein WCH99_01835 [Verrucomicrobiota bacterium]
MADIVAAHGKKTQNGNEQYELSVNNYFPSSVRVIRIVPKLAEPGGFDCIRPFLGNGFNADYATVLGRIIIFSAVKSLIVVFVMGNSVGVARKHYCLEVTKEWNDKFLNTEAAAVTNHPKIKSDLSESCQKKTKFFYFLNLIKPL